MTKILLACNAGMSTSILVKKIQDEGKARGLEIQCEAMPISVAEKEFSGWDIVMLGPQVRHQLKGMQNAVNGAIPIEVIDMRAYGMMDGKKVLNQAIAAIDKFKKA